MARVTPPEALWTYRRLRLPPVQRRPSPKFRGAIEIVPCRKMVEAVGSSPADVNTSVSLASDALPATESTAPPEADAEFLQPLSMAPEFAQGQAPALPSPKQNGAPAGAPRSRRKTSYTPFVSPATRFEARLANTTKRPSAEIDESMLSSFDCPPLESTLTRSVVPN